MYCTKNNNKYEKTQEVSLAVLERICNYVECNFGDLIEYVEDNLKDEGGVNRCD